MIFYVQWASPIKKRIERNSRGSWGSGEIEFGEFCQLCAKFLIEEPDEETMKPELKEAFRVYDKEANGFITTGVLREIIAELDTR